MHRYNYWEIINQARDIILVLDLTGRIMKCNQAAVAAYGYSREELEQLSIFDLQSPSALFTAAARLQQAISTGILFECIHRRKDGTEFPVEVSSKQFDGEGQAMLVSMIRDVTQRLCMQEACLLERQQKLHSEMLFEKRYEAISAGVVVQDINGTIVYSNPAASEILGYSDGQIQGKNSGSPQWQPIDTDGNYFPPEKHPISITLNTGQSVQNVVHGIHNGKTGEVRWLLMTSKPIIDEASGNMVEAIVTFIDISELRSTQRALQDREEKFHSLFSNMLEGVCMHELLFNDEGQPADYRIIDFNPAYEKILNVKRENMLGQLASEVYPQGEAPYLAEYSKVVLQQQNHYMESYFAPLDKYFAISVAPWEKQGFATIFTDITDVKKAQQELLRKNQELERIATIDMLTGIWNRHYFEGFIGREISRTNRSEQPLTLILFDIDRFKTFNDNYGHQVGDRILQQVARLIGRNIRQGDCFARWGGDEFIILLPDTASLDGCQLAEKLRSLVYQHEFLPDCRVTLSMGVTGHKAGESANRWFKRADKALYQAKDAGRNKVHCL